MYRSRTSLSVATLLVAAAVSTVSAQSLPALEEGAGTLKPSLNNEANAAIDRSLDWLSAKQQEAGNWSNAAFPALTALAAWPFIESGHAKEDEVLKKALTFIASKAKPDGGIYTDIPGRKGGGLGNYNTAICMTVLHASGDPTYRPLVLKAREYMANNQHLGGDVYDGGFGYDASTKRAYADLLNTFYATQAMRLTEGAEEFRPKDQKRVSVDWSRTVKFIQQLQNDEQSGEDNEGGFVYKPDEKPEDAKGGTMTNANGTVVFRSYGSITYAGMLAMVYAHVDRDDARVRSAFDWASRHWTLKENPGMGSKGLYFFYYVLARSMDVYGPNLVPTDGGKHFVDWRTELADTLVGLQKIDPNGQGYWLNAENHYWEADPVLVTSYALMALRTAAGR
jgi:squalene-hopene/tetraprenyl-beta-curcumene cyclase